MPIFCSWQSLVTLFAPREDLLVDHPFPWTRIHQRKILTNGSLCSGYPSLPKLWGSWRHEVNWVFVPLSSPSGFWVCYQRCVEQLGPVSLRGSWSHFSYPRCHSHKAPGHPGAGDIARLLDSASPPTPCPLFGTHL